MKNLLSENTSTRLRMCKVHNSLIRSDEGLTLETSASESLYGGQFTLSTQLIKPNYLVILPPTQHHSFFRNLPPLCVKYCYSNLGAIYAKGLLLCSLSLLFGGVLVAVAIMVCLTSLATRPSQARTPTLTFFAFFHTDCV